MTIKQKEIVLSPKEIAKKTNGEWIGDIRKLKILGMYVGPHQTQNGFMMVCTSGEFWGANVADTHQYISIMIQKGASSIMVEKSWWLKNKVSFDIPILVVENTNKAVINLSIASRDKSAAKRVLISGSEGKTGFKYALNFLIGKQHPSYAQETSSNLTAPILLSLCSIKKDSEFVIVEVSCPQPNRCTQRSNYVLPDLVVITNLNISHINTHGSIENLINHKLENINGLKENGKLVINKDTTFYKQFVDKVKLTRPDIEIFEYSEKDQTAHAYVKSAEFEDLGWNIEAVILGNSYSYRINKPHSHMPLSSCGVLLTMALFNLDIEKATRDYKNYNLYWDSMGKISKLKIDSGSFIFYDQHFSITEKALHSSLMDMKNIKVPGKKIAVISGELNSANEVIPIHKRIAQYIDESDIDILLTVGEHMDISVNSLQRTGVFHGHFFNSKQVIPVLMEYIKDGDLVLVKGMTRLEFKHIAKAIYDNFSIIENK